MKKLFLSLFFLGVSFFFPVSLFASSSCATYSDVNANDWFCPALTFLQEKSILDKKPTFSPSENLNRAEGLKIMVMASGERELKTHSAFFDINEKAWFKSYFYTAYALKYIESVNGKFDASAPLSKAEFLILYMKFLNIEPATRQCSIKEGMPVGEWMNLSVGQANMYLCKAQELKLASTFFEETINRAVSAQILFNVLQLTTTE
jgi:hypothetical protein